MGFFVFFLWLLLYPIIPAGWSHWRGLSWQPMRRFELKMNLLGLWQIWQSLRTHNPCQQTVQLLSNIHGTCMCASESNHARVWVMDEAAGMTYMWAGRCTHVYVHIIGMCTTCECVCLCVSVCVTASVMDQAIPGMTFLWASLPVCACL